MEYALGSLKLSREYSYDVQVYVVDQHSEKAAQVASAPPQANPSLVIAQVSYWACLKIAIAY